MAELSFDKAKEVIDNGLGEAKKLLGDGGKMKELLSQAEEKIKTLPLVGEDITNIPVIISMIKSYITKEYTEVSVKVIASVVSALIYLIKRKDVIPDSIPVLGLVDDVAVITLVMKLNKPEIDAFKAWRETQKK